MGLWHEHKRRTTALHHYSTKGKTMSYTPEKRSEHNRRYQRKLKQQLIDAYGGRCICCGEATYEFLTLEHLNGGGTAHRERLGSTNMVYLEVIKLGFPDEYTILCMNCN